MQPDPSAYPQPYPSAYPSADPHFESRATPSPTTPATPVLTSSLSDAQTRGRANEQTITSRIRSIPQAAALARLIADLRPAWDPADVYAWALNDSRPWDVVVRAGVAGACDWHVIAPAGLRHVGPQLGPEYDEKPTPLPPTLAEYRAAPRCEHGAELGRCFPCRAHRRTEEPA